jgi:hypothetical protein
MTAAMVTAIGTTAVVATGTIGVAATAVTADRLA